jgi:hypothetical protein
MRRGLRLGAGEAAYPARVETEPVELVADLLIESREEPALVGSGIESREVRFS